MTAKPLIVVFPPDAGPKNSAAVKHLWTSKNEVSSHNPDTILEAIIKTACDFHLTVPLKCFINKDIPNLGTFFQITMKLFHDPYMYSTILVDALNFEWPWTLISMLDRFEAPIPEDSEQIIQVARYAIKFKDIFDGLFRRCCKRDATLRTIMLPSVIPTRNFELVKDMINLGAAVNTPRVRAAFADLITGINERNPIAEFLLQHGLDISEKTTDSRDILFVAVQKDNFEMAKLMLEHGADPNHSIYLLHEILAYRNFEFLKLFVDYEIDLLPPLRNKNFVSSYNREEENITGLHYAARSGNLETFKYLAEQGVPPPTLDSNGKTIAQSATQDIKQYLRLIELFHLYQTFFFGAGEDSDLSVLPKEVREYIFKAIITITNPYSHLGIKTSARLGWVHHLWPPPEKIQISTLINSISWATDLPPIPEREDYRRFYVISPKGEKISLNCSHTTSNWRHDPGFMSSQDETFHFDWKFTDKDDMTPVQTTITKQRSQYLSRNKSGFDQLCATLLLNNTSLQADFCMVLFCLAVREEKGRPNNYQRPFEFTSPWFCDAQEGTKLWWIRGQADNLGSALERWVQDNRHQEPMNPDGLEVYYKKYNKKR